MLRCDGSGVTVVLVALCGGGANNRESGVGLRGNGRVRW